MIICLVVTSLSILVLANKPRLVIFQDNYVNIRFAILRQLSSLAILMHTVYQSPSFALLLCDLSMMLVRRPKHSLCISNSWILTFDNIHRWIRRVIEVRWGSHTVRSREGSIEVSAIIELLFKCKSCVN